MIYIAFQSSLIVTLGKVLNPFRYAAKCVIKLEKHWHQNLSFRVFIFELEGEHLRESRFIANEYTPHLPTSREPGKFQVT